MVLDTLKEAPRSSIVVYLAVAVVAVIAAVIAWQIVMSSGAHVAVVPVEGTITGTTAVEYSLAMERARTTPSVKAVVVVSRSGGGIASASEEMYLATKRTAREMPVIAAIDSSSTSGAYFALAPADYIFAKPASQVGSIGVVGRIPPDVEPNDIFGTTGPNKLTGAGQRDFFYSLDSVQNAFLGAVFQQRGRNLTISRAGISRAEIYTGTQAVQVGLVDEIGGQAAAIRKAADRADLDRFSVETFRSNVTTYFVSRNNYLASPAPQKRMLSPSQFLGKNSAPLVLMMPESYLSQAVKNQGTLVSSTIENSTSATSGGVSG